MICHTDIPYRGSPRYDQNPRRGIMRIDMLPYGGLFFRMYYCGVEDLNEERDFEVIEVIINIIFIYPCRCYHIIPIVDEQFVDSFRLLVVNDHGNECGGLSGFQ